MLDDPRAFNGPAGAVIEPSSLNSIAIGLFAPFDRDDPAARDLYRGIKLAIEQANAAGGYRGVDFSLIRRWAGSPWAAGPKEVIRLIYEDRVWAIIAFKDGAAHIAQQIAAKAYVPVIAPLSSAPSLTHAGVPWLFRLPPDDRVQAGLLVKEGIVNKHFSRVGLVSCTAPNNRAAAAEMEKELERRNLPALFHFEVAPGLLDFQPHSRGGAISGSAAGSAFDFQALAERIRDFQPHVLTLCLQVPGIPKLLKALQSSGIVCPVCIPWTPGVEIKKLKAVYHGPIYMIEPFQPPDREKTGGIYHRFSRDFEKRFGVFPTCSAAYAYDAAWIIILSIRSKGLNRPGIRLGLEGLAGHEGVSGTIKWDNRGGSPGSPVVKEFR
ncbi:MAG: ABC transporter substrate-binding protein [Candidatus Aminicenantes bacterium]|nr:ABC transporter substrate-binding protein [Candidatus Aminicenantes bacterium]